MTGGSTSGSAPRWSAASWPSTSTPKSTSLRPYGTRCAVHARRPPPPRLSKSLLPNPLLLFVLLLLGLLLAERAAAAAAAAAAVVADEPWHPGRPTGWDSAPSTIAEFPHTVDPRTNRTTYLVDPWKYSQRLGAYKTLLGSATALHFGPGAFGNPLWGLPLQFSWQHDTGRLLSDSATDAINASSWWGGMNYMLSTIPFIAGLEAQVIPVPDGAQVHILPPPPVSRTPSDRFCTNYTECLRLVPNATRGWTDFMHAVKKGGLAVNESVRMLWTGHIASLHEGLPRMQPLLGRLPSDTEAKFGVSWANLVDFVAALRFDVNYNNTNFLQGMIVPPRLLTAEDKAPFIKDFTGAQNRALVVATVIDDANKATGGGLLRLFARACCTADGRQDAYGAMISLLEGKGLLAVEDVIKLVVDLVKSHPCH